MLTKARQLMLGVACCIWSTVADDGYLRHQRDPRRHQFKASLVHVPRRWQPGTDVKEPACAVRARSGFLPGGEPMRFDDLRQLVERPVDLVVGKVDGVRDGRLRHEVASLLN